MKKSEVNNDFYSWIHDDITWCAEPDCPVINCMRNCVNMMDHTGLHSFAMLRGTDLCPIKMRDRMDGTCMDACAHAKDCFNQYKDPDDALRMLGDTYCDNCILSEQEED